MDSLTLHPDPAERYRARAARFDAEEGEARRRSRRWSRSRLACFLGLAAAAVGVEGAGPELRRVLFLWAALLVAAFAALVVAHTRSRREERRLRTLGDLNREGLARLSRQWDALPDPDLPPPPEDHPYADDLDLYGRASLVRLLSTVTTAPGRLRLARWLLAPVEADPPAERQRAVRELADRHDFRDDLAAGGRLLERVDPGALERFLGWAESRPAVTTSRATLWAARILPLLTSALAAADLAGALPWPFWLVSIGATWMLLRRHRDHIGAGFQQASAEDSGLRRYGSLMERVSESDFEAPALRAIQARLTAEGVPAHGQLRRLERRLDAAELRHSALFHLPANLLLAWDVHVHHALERWRDAAGHRVGDWVEALGEIDALCALAALASDHPDWAFPVGASAGMPPRLQASALGHPLLPPDRCVRNDVTVGPPGTFLLVTGSNMSGKSTLLRAIGVNVVLARAGGRVCAERLILPPVRLHTSMRVRDSLEEGVSFFMAELRRLKGVVDAARDRTGDGSCLLYLLDEILQGTNTVERQIAARTILRHLLESRAIGAVTTHDLTLADADDLRRRARAVHFQEVVAGTEGAPVLSFDYLLRPGIATSTNALELMAVVGLPRVESLGPDDGDAP